MEIGSWLRVSYDIIDGQFKYLFGGMQLQPLTGDMTRSSRNRGSEEDLQPMDYQMEQWMISIKKTISSFTCSPGENP